MKKRNNNLNLKNKALNISIKEGSANAVMNGVGNSFITPYALELMNGLSIQTVNFYIGFLSSFSGIISPIAQIFSIKFMERLSRKTIVLYSVFFQALIWIPLMLLGLMQFYKIGIEYIPILLIFLYSLHIGIGAFAGPAWFSWMGDLVPEHKRGMYFSKRNRIIGFIAIISMLIAGFLLDFFKTKGLILLGFTIFFSIGMFARIYSYLLLRKQYSPELILKDGYYFSFWQFLKKLPESNFGIFSLYLGLMYFAVSIAGPFFNVYMLKELNLSYVWFTVINLASSVFSLLALPFLGKFGDKYGNRRLLMICSIFVPLVPILWMLSPNPWYLIFVPSLIGGIFWAGFDLAGFNFTYDSVKTEHRALCAAYNGMLVGIGIFSGSIIGGVIAKFTPTTLGLGIFLFIFLISGIARIIATAIFIPLIKEVKPVKKPPLLIKEFKFLSNFEHSFHHFRLGFIHLPFLTSIDKKSFSNKSL